MDPILLNLKQVHPLLIYDAQIESRFIGFVMIWFKCVIFCLSLGFGVFAKEQLLRGQFLLQYVGEKISCEEAMQRERKSAENKMFIYTYKGQKYW